MNRPRLWVLARSYWFDALLAVAVVVGVVEVVVTQDVKDGPRGPLWFDVLAVLGMTLPLFARRRFPFGAPVASGRRLRGELVRRRATHPARSRSPS